MNDEAKALIEIMAETKTEKYGGIEFFTGRLEGVEAVISVCGVGKVFAAVCAQTMILRYSPSEIINIGVAGGLNPKLKIADTVVAQRVCQHDMDTSALGDPKGMVSGVNMIYFPCDENIVDGVCKAASSVGIECLRGTVASGDLFVSDSEKKSFIRETFGADSCEMEGGAIGQVCYVANVPFCVIRSISDGGDESANTDFYTFLQNAVKNGTSILRAYMRSKA
jgi:adenosylhomocysteine nucleosidase